MRYRRDIRTGAAILCDARVVEQHFEKNIHQHRIDSLQREIDTLKQQIRELQDHVFKNNTDN